VKEKKMKRTLIALCLFAAAPAFAQQGPPEPAFLQVSIGALQTQRNQAMDAAAIAEARLAVASDDLARAKTRIKELEPKPDEPKK
jgi:hypothetical protein